MLGHACGKQDDANSQGNEQRRVFGSSMFQACFWVYPGPTLDSAVELR